MSPILFVVGVDECGYGSLAGPLLVAAAAFPADARRVVAEWRGSRGVKTLEVTDSKKVRSQEHRAALDAAIRQSVAACAVVEKTPREIDAQLVHRALQEATRLAISRCLEKLLVANKNMSARSVMVLVDGDGEEPDVPCPVRTIIGGDASDWRIGAASILAKTAHDAKIAALHDSYPEWGFDKSRGYPTKTHREILEERGPIADVHRMSYAPVRAARGDVPGLERP